LLDVLKERELYSEELVQRIIENEGKLRDLEDLPEDIRNAFPTAMEVAPEWHVRMQAAWQENIDSSISKTVNLPYQSTVEDIENIYLLAYELGTKSITVYRDKSLELQVLNVPSTSPKDVHQKKLKNQDQRGYSRNDQRCLQVSRRNSEQAQVRYTLP